MSIVQEIRQRRDEKVATNWNAYRDLLRSMAAGETVDSAEIELTVDMVDRSLEELDRDIQVTKRRLHLAAIVSAESARLARLRTAESELQAAVDAMVAERNRLQAVVADRQASMTAAAKLHEECAHAVMELARTCFDEKLLTREAAIKAEINTFRNDLQNMEVHSPKLASLIRSQREMVPKAVSPKAASLLEADIADNEFRLNKLNDDIAPLRARMDALTAEANEIQQAKLLP